MCATMFFFFVEAFTLTPDTHLPSPRPSTYQTDAQCNCYIRLDEAINEAVASWTLIDKYEKVERNLHNGK